MPNMPGMPAMPGMKGSASGVPMWDTLGAVGLLLWSLAMWAAVGGLIMADRGGRRPWVYRASLTVIVIGVIGQIGHLAEHVAQAVYWIGHANAPAWMTPWGTGLARGFGQVDKSKPTLGMEILHLDGNFIFLSGIAAVMVITRRARTTQTRRWGRMGMWMQTIHGMEHISLTLSVWLGAKKAIGLSTWFGLMAAGPGATTYRVWWHFIANVMGSYIFAMAVWNLRRENGEICKSFGIEPKPTGPQGVGPRQPVGAPA
jgi:hypothetical protein